MHVIWEVMQPGYDSTLRDALSAIVTGSSFSTAQSASGSDWACSVLTCVCTSFETTSSLRIYFAYFPNP